MWTRIFLTFVNQVLEVFIRKTQITAVVDHKIVASDLKVLIFRRVYIVSRAFKINPGTHENTSESYLLHAS